MNDRDRAVKRAKAGYFAIVAMLIVNLLLASFVFFEVGLDKPRELFLAIGTLMALIYAVTFPTKLLPSGSYLLRCIVFLVLPLILIELIATPYGGAVSIVSYAISLIISIFCAYICIGYEVKILKYVSEENYNDYSLFEAKTFKTQEINIYSLAFLFINLFIMLSAGNDLILTIVLYVNMFVGLTLNFYRTRFAKSDKVKMSYYVLESISTILAFSLIVVVSALELPTLVNIGALVLFVPTVAMTIMTYKAIDKFMYK